MKLMIFWLMILKIHTEVLISSGSPMRFHILCNMRRAGIRLNTFPSAPISDDRTQMIQHSPKGFRSFREVFGHMIDELDHDTDVRKHMSKSEYCPPYLNHPSVYKLRLIFASLTYDMSMNTFKYFTRQRVRENQDIRK